MTKHYKSLTEIVEVKRAGTLPDGLCAHTCGDFVTATVDGQVVHDALIDTFAEEAMVLLGIKVDK